MQLLYLDDSGSVQNQADRNIILAGLAVGERDPYWIGRDLDTVAGRYWPDDPLSVEFRGADLFSGKRHWRGIARSERQAAFRSVLEVLIGRRTVRLFGAVVRRESCGVEDPMEVAFEIVASRFDRMLGRMHKGGDTHRGIIILDNSTYETSLQRLAIDFRQTGHRWGRLNNLSEVPLFVDSRASRLIQAADLVAYSLRMAFERQDPTYLDLISSSFDRSGGQMLGLIHLKPAQELCNCVACASGVPHHFVPGIPA